MNAREDVLAFIEQLAKFDEMFNALADGSPADAPSSRLMFRRAANEIREARAFAEAAASKMPTAEQLIAANKAAARVPKKAKKKGPIDGK